MLKPLNPPQRRENTCNATTRFCRLRTGKMKGEMFADPSSWAFSIFMSAFVALTAVVAQGMKTPWKPPPPSSISSCFSEKNVNEREILEKIFFSRSHLLCVNPTTNHLIPSDYLGKSLESGALYLGQGNMGGMNARRHDLVFIITDRQTESRGFTDPLHPHFLPTIPGGA